MSSAMSRKYRFLAFALFVLGAAAQAQAPYRSLTVHVTLARELGEHAASGRVIVELSHKPPQGGVLDPGFILSGPDAVWVAAQEVEHLAPGATAEINADALAFPAPLSTAPAGHWWAMALLDVDHNAAYHFFSPGDLHSPVVR